MSDTKTKIHAYAERARARIAEMRSRSVPTTASCEFENSPGWDHDLDRKARILAMAWRLDRRIAQAERQD